MGEIKLSLSKDLQAIVAHEVELGDYADEAAFIETLIRDYHEKKLATLIEALESGERSGFSERSIDEIIAEAKRKAGIRTA